MSSTIMIIEDHKALRQALYNWVQTAFPTVQIVEGVNNTDALGLTKVHFPDVIIMGFGSTIGNDMQIVQQLKVMMPLAEIILLASFVDEVYRAQALSVGATAVISTKQISQTLQPLVQSLISITSPERAT